MNAICSRNTYFNSRFQISGKYNNCTNIIYIYFILFFYLNFVFKIIELIFKCTGNMLSKKSEFYYEFKNNNKFQHFEKM